jgi:putative SbcD/Mre11-related phosphoesterase
MINPLFPHPAVLLRTQKIRLMAIADLHIGWEMALAQRGIHVPTQTPRLAKKLTDLIFTYSPLKLLVLGDVKHTVAKAEIGEWRDVPDFFNETRKHILDISVVRGNHDGNLEPLLPENTKILPSTGVTIDNVGFFHGHQWPSPTLLGCTTLVMGHVHPVVAFRDPAGFRITRQVWIKANCNAAELARVLLKKHKVRVKDSLTETLWKHFKVKPKTQQLFIMPSFNDFLGGRPLNERKSNVRTEREEIIGPILRSDAVDFGNAEAYLLDGTFLGTLNQLRMWS